MMQCSEKNLTTLQGIRELDEPNFKMSIRKEQQGQFEGGKKMQIIKKG